MDDRSFVSLAFSTPTSQVVLATRPDGGVRLIEPSEPELWALAVSGDLGVVAPYVPPPKVPQFATAAAAEAAAVEWIDAFVAPFHANIPLEERLSWPVKILAAQAYVSGDPDPSSRAVIEAEAEIVGDDPDVLARAILENAAVSGVVASHVAGLRRKLKAEIAAVDDPFEYAAVLERGIISARRFAVDLGLSSLLLGE